MSTQVIDKPIATLESLCQFKGESLVKLGDMSTSEAIRLGVSLVVRGEENKARGVFVLASKAKSLTEADAKTFRESLKNEMIMSAKARAVELLGANAPAPKLEAAKKAAEGEAVRRFDNINQTMRAAQWMLSNPDKLADSVSVFTVQQVNAYLELPADTADKAEEKKAVRKAVLPLLKAPGTSQGVIKEAVKTAKEAHAKKSVVVDGRTDEQKKADARTQAERALVGRIVNSSKDWEGLVTEGSTPDGLRKLLIVPTDVSQGTLADAVRTLAKLAGLEVK